MTSTTATTAPSADPARTDAGWNTRGRWLGEHLRRRRWAVVTIIAFVMVSMAFTLAWGPVVRHQSIWVVPGDIWYTFRVAHLIGWGDIGGIYDPMDGQLTFPGAAAALAPVAMLSWHFQLSESIGLMTVLHPSAWLLLGPVILVVGSTSLLAFDALAEELGVGRGRRIGLLAAEAVIAFVVVTLWGHPEDLLATGLAVYAILAGKRSRWSAAGWLWGAAIAVQPLVLVMLPVTLAATPAGRRFRTCVLAAVPTAALMAGPLLTQWSMTTRTLLHQANDPLVNHATPWITLSTRIDANSVTAGPGRIITLVLSVGIGMLAVHRRPSLQGLLWLAALALSLRCLVEAVMVPFYLGPPFALIVLACASRPGRSRLVLGSVAFLVATVISFRHLSEWTYWSPIAALLIVGLACAYPGRSAVTGAVGPRHTSTVDTVPGGVPGATVGPGVRST